MSTHPWPYRQPGWLVPWAKWYIGGGHGVRPPAEGIIPMWAWEFVEWCVWRHNGAKPPRPAQISKIIPQWAWTALPLVYANTRPSSVVPDIFRRYVFVDRLSNFSGIERSMARSRGYNTIAVTLDGASNVSTANSQELDQHGHVYEAEGWRFVGWSAPQVGDPIEQARRDTVSAHSHPLHGWISNWEEWGESHLQWRADAWLHEWLMLGNTMPLALSCLSSQTPNFARLFNYKPWLNTGATIAPQVYGDVYPAYTVANMLATMKKGGVPVGLLAPTFGDVGPGPTPYNDYDTWHEARGVWIGGQVRNWSKL